MRASEVRNDLLNRWVRMKQEKKEVKTSDMPRDPGTVSSISEAEKWRSKIVEILSDKINKLYKDPLPEQQIRYLNDKANALMRKLRRWELRILELGGIDYGKVGIQTPNGDILNTNQNQYQYFGRARKLPGVQQLIESEKQRTIDNINMSNKKKKREEYMEKVDASYYGLEPEDGIEEIEKLYEQRNGAPNFSPLPS